MLRSPTAGMVPALLPGAVRRVRFSPDGVESAKRAAGKGPLFSLRNGRVLIFFAILHVFGLDFEPD